LSKGVNAGDSEAAEAIRDIVETVTEFRNPKHIWSIGVRLEIAQAEHLAIFNLAIDNKLRACTSGHSSPSGEDDLVSRIRVVRLGY
jgi:hypothetical protein